MSVEDIKERLEAVGVRFSEEGEIDEVMGNSWIISLEKEEKKEKDRDSTK